MFLRQEILLVLVGICFYVSVFEISSHSITGPHLELHILPFCFYEHDRQGPLMLPDSIMIRNQMVEMHNQDIIT